MKWIRTMVCALGMLACVSLSAFAAEYGEPNITTKTTMKELRENKKTMNSLKTFPMTILALLKKPRSRAHSSSNPYWNSLVPVQVVEKHLM